MTGPLPAVSVVMNVRDGAATLREAIESVVEQTFAGWELILWDDQSTDDSAAIAASFDDPRIRYFLSPGSRNLGEARQRAIDQARAPWLAFLDQDDVWLPRKLEMQMALTRDPSVGLIYGRTLRFFPSGRQHDFDHHHEFEALPEGDLFEKLVRHSCFVALSSAMLRRSAVEEAGPIPQWMEIIPDYWLFLAVTRHHQAAAVQSVVCRYRVHAGSITHTRWRRLHENAVTLIEHWSGAIPPSLARRRRRIHETCIAFAELRSPRETAAGLVRLLRQGSVSFLVSRPLARAWRSLRRMTRTPEWKRAGLAASGGGVRATVISTPVSVGTFQGTVEDLALLVHRRRAAYVSSANAFSVCLARSDARHRENLQGAAIVTPDGMSVVWALRALGHRVERVHNDDLFFACCRAYPRWRHFLVGGREGQPEAVAAELRQRFPGIRIVGLHPTPVRPVPPDETAAILDGIREARPDVVWVAQGTPAQDDWMRAVHRLAGVPMVGVGSLFDLLAGRTRPAPEWVKQAGLQWAFRLAQEPRRLAGRYLLYNPLFVLSFARQWMVQAAAGRASLEWLPAGGPPRPAHPPKGSGTR